MNKYDEVILYAKNYLLCLEKIEILFPKADLKKTNDLVLFSIKPLFEYIENEETTKKQKTVAIRKCQTSITAAYIDLINLFVNYLSSYILNIENNIKDEVLIRELKEYYVLKDNFYILKNYVDKRHILYTIEDGKVVTFISSLDLLIKIQSKMFIVLYKEKKRTIKKIISIFSEGVNKHAALLTLISIILTIFNIYYPNLIEYWESIILFFENIK